MVVSNMFYFHPYLGKISNLTSIFFRWVGSTTNQTTKQNQICLPSPKGSPDHGLDHIWRISCQLFVRQNCHLSIQNWSNMKPWRIHGTGIFTYMKTIKINQMWKCRYIPVPWILWGIPKLRRFLILEYLSSEYSPQDLFFWGGLFGGYHAFIGFLRGGVFKGRG